ncbi:3-phosphoshikimate 1-carboxyvinyltransferase, chloroplastic-like [Lolium rigidum]|uniref:3-phosphoshikimate 1-carboxyvinyltransferase, chloroplastic-like n=1 Tax=Lolium rigidum TaxID=89674 RepID=UPI001F5E14E3|nr:3-phosphoshikimate 1-carboxyvinyltransferase, chloroplastic-like [Lolium rigidum]
MLEALDALGLSVEADKVAKRAVVVGCGGRFPIEKDAKEEVKLFLGNAGTAMRPLTAAVVAAGGNATYVLDGVPRMRERPIGDLVVGLKQLGASVHCFLGTDCPPVRINGIGGLPGGKVKLSHGRAGYRCPQEPWPAGKSSRRRAHSCRPLTRASDSMASPWPVEAAGRSSTGDRW